MARHQALRVAVTNPFAWPYVRRGSERLLNDLAAYLHAQGMQVDVYAMAPSDAQELREGVRYHLLAERWRFNRRQLNSMHYFALRLQSALRDDPPDVVFCLNYFDAYAALRARRRHGLSYKVVFQSVGIPISSYYRTVPLDRWFMRTVLREADRCVVLSSFARDTLRRDFGVEAQILPPPVDTDLFAGEDTSGAPDGAPSLLFVGDVDEPRKGAVLLCEAFARLRAEWPGLRLRFVGRASEERRRHLLALPALGDAGCDVEFVGLGDVGELPALYRAASVTVLPSVWEAFGLVLVESLAAGTPVVGARHGGIGDIVEGPPVGALFEPGVFRRESHAVDALADALRSVLSRGKDAAVRSACRVRAEAFGWRTLGPRYAEMVQALHVEPTVEGSR